MPGPTLTVQLPSFAHYSGWTAATHWNALLDIARSIEDAGVDRLAIVDHVVMSHDSERQFVEQFDWATSYGVPPNTDYLEPLSFLALVAGATSRVRLSTRIVNAALRPAVLLAKAVATIDVISEGRVDLGVGVGWQRDEFGAAGVDFSKRGRLLDETIDACRTLWTESPATYSSLSVSFTQMYSHPQPVQARLPVWFSGALHDKNVDRIVRLGDGWIPLMNASLEDVRTGASRLAARVSGKAGRRITVQGPVPVSYMDRGAVDYMAMMRSARSLVESGASDIFVNLAAIAPRPEDAPSALTELTAHFRRAF